MLTATQTISAMDQSAINQFMDQSFQTTPREILTSPFCIATTFGCCYLISRVARAENNLRTRDAELLASQNELARIPLTVRLLASIPVVNHMEDRNLDENDNGLRQRNRPEPNQS